MELLCLFIGIFIFSATGMAVACWFMRRWVHRIIADYVKETFNAKYDSFIRRFVVLYEKHDKKIKKLEDDCKDKRAG